MNGRGQSLDIVLEINEKAISGNVSITLKLLF